MSNSIDQRIVEMDFDNAKFKKGVDDTVQSLNQLDKSLQLEKGAKSMAALENLSKGTNFSGLHSALSSIGETMANAGNVALNAFTAVHQKISDIARVATVGFGAAAAAVVGLTAQGGIKRALNLEHAQFQLKGLLDSEEAVQAVMTDVQKAARGTAFGLDEVAVVASQLTASNVKANAAGGDLYETLRGIAGTAAMGGRSFADVGNIFATIAGQGKVMTMQLRQFEAMGINVAATLSKYMGKSEAEIRDMVTKGEIGFEEFAYYMDQAFGEHSQKANETFTGAMSNVKAALSRIGEAFATPSIENLRKIFVALIPAIDGVKAALAPVIEDFKALTGPLTDAVVDRINKWTTAEQPANKATWLFSGGLSKLSEAIAYASEQMKVFSIPAKEFEKVFPRLGFATSRGLAVIEDNLKNVFDFHYQGIFNNISKGLLEISRVLPGVVDYLGIVNASLLDSQLKFAVSVLEGITGAFVNLLPVAEAIGQAFSEVFPALVGDENPLVSWGQAIRDFLLSIQPSQEILDSVHRAFVNFFSIIKDFGTIGVGIVEGLGSAIKGFLEAIGVNAENGLDALADALGWMHEHINAAGIADGFRSLGEAIGLFFKAVGSKDTGIFAAIGNFFDKLQEMAEKSGILASLTEVITSFFNALFGIRGEGDIKTFGDVIGDLLKRLGEFGRNIPQMFGNAIQGIKNFISDLGLTAQDFLGIINTIIFGMSANVLRDVGDRFYKAFKEPYNLIQTIVNFDVDKRLEGNLLALQNALNSFTAQLRVTNFLKLAAAIALVAASLWLLGSMDPQKLASGLAALTLSLIVLSAAFNEIVAIGNKSEWARLGGTTFALIGLAAALLLFGASVKLLGSMDFKSVAQGLLSFIVLTGVLTRVVGSLSKIKDTELIKVTAALNGIAFAMLGMVTVIALFGKMKPQTLIQGFAALAITLLGLIGALSLMGSIEGSVLKMAVSLMILAQALTLIAVAMKIMGSMSFESLAVAIVAMGSALLMLGLALEYMDGNIAGAGALIVAAAALAILAVSIGMLSVLPIPGLVASLIILAAAVGLFALAASKIPPTVVGTMYGLAGAVALFGVGLAAIAAGIMMFSIALVTLAGAGVGAFAIIGEGLKILLADILTLLPDLATAVGESLIRLAGVILEGIASLSPKLAEALRGLIEAVRIVVPDLILLGAELLTALLQGIEMVFPQLISTGIALLVALGEGIIIALPTLVEIGFVIIITFIQSLADSIRSHHNEMYEAGKDLFMAILEALVDIFGNIATDIGSFIMDIPAYISGEKQLFADAGTDLGESVSTGAKNGMADLPKIGEESSQGFLDGIKSKMDNSGDLFGSLNGQFAEVPIAFDGALSQLPQIGSENGLDTVSAVTESMSGLPAYAAETASQTSQSFNSNLDFNAEENVDSAVGEIQGSVGDFHSAAVQTGDAAVSGADSSMSGYVGTFSSRSSQASSSLRNSSGSMYSNGHYAGSMGGQGLVDGLNSKISSVSNAASALANNAANAIRNALVVKSPSRVTKQIGAYTAEGLAIGIRDNAFLAENAARDMALSAMNAMTSQVAYMSELIDEMDASPTIRPVLDLDEVMMGMSAFDSMALTSQMVSAGRVSAFSQNRMAGIANTDNSRAATYYIDLHYSNDADANLMVEELTNALRSKNLMEA